MEPVRVLRERGVEPHVYYANSNIAPRDEYERRRETLRTWAGEEELAVTEGDYAPERWKAAVADAPTRPDRCRACYRMRFEEAAAWAREHGYEALGTTLSVSPYQYTDAIREELERACSATGLTPAFEDWRPYYDEATRRSREAGMYRQNYCGCALSAAEAAQERAERKAARSREREQWRVEHADELAAQEAARAARQADRQAYAQKRAHQRAILKALRQKD